MANYSYPSTDLDQSRQLIALLGTHWADTYAGSHFLESYLYARAQAEKQVDQDVQEAIDTTSRFKVPVYHTDLWHRFLLKESELNSPRIAALRYDETGVVYGNQPESGIEHRYGLSATNSLFSFPISSDLAYIPAIFNRTFEPSRVWLPGIDFVLDPLTRAIRFRANPFEDELVSSRPVYEGDEIVDREIAIWAFHVQFDWRYIWQHYGHVLDVKTLSSKPYRDFVNAIWDGLVQGSHHQAVASACAALADAPVARGSETVEVVQQDSQRLNIITDQAVYQASLAANSLVSVGDRIREGELLTDAVQIFEFNRGNISTEIKALTLGKGLLLEGYYDGVTFHNKDVDVVVNTSGDYTQVSFELGGWPGDVVKFWDDFHSRGVAAGETLAHLLDQRTNPVGEPVAANLPAIINPARFLVENVLRNNAFAILFRPDRFGEDALDLGLIRELRRIIPPHTVALVVVQLAVDADIVTMEGPGDETEPGYEEDLDSYRAFEPFEEALDPDVYISEDEPALRYVDGLCL